MDVAALETIRIWELGQLVTERPNTPIALPWKTKEEVIAREKEVRAAMDEARARNAKLESEAEHRKSGT